MINVLYIDDEADSEKMLSKFDVLRFFDINVISEKDLTHLLGKLDIILNGIDLIVVDMIMPTKDEYNLDDTNGGKHTGIAVIKDIRKVNKKIPIIIVSILHRNSFDEKLLQALNISDFKEKSITAEELSYSIKNNIIN